MATSAAITSADGVYTITCIISTDPDSGEYDVDLNITTQTGTDTLTARVNGQQVWQGLAAEATGG